MPLIAVQYRSWGTLSLSRLFLILAFMVYLIAIPMYTLLPIGIDVAAVCAAGNGPVTQHHPFAFVDHVRTAWASTTLRGFLGSDVVQEPVLNVIFFVPLGVFLRKLNRWPVWAVVLAGFGTSLLVELTQLTGNWGSAECAYRVFSVDDLILNTAGTIIGIIFAPLLEMFPGVRLDPGRRHPGAADHAVAAGCPALLRLGELHPDRDLCRDRRHGRGGRPQPDRPGRAGRCADGDDPPGGGDRAVRRDPAVHRGRDAR